MLLDQIRVTVTPSPPYTRECGPFEALVDVKAIIPGVPHQDFHVRHLFRPDDLVSHFDRSWELLGQHVKQLLHRAATNAANHPKKELLYEEDHY